MTQHSAPPPPITVVLVGDHLATRELICEHLNTDPAVQLLAKAHDARADLQRIRELVSEAGEPVDPSPR